MWKLFHGQNFPLHSPYRRLDYDGHNGNAQPAARHYKDFHELPAPLKILGYHQRGTVSRDADSDPHDRSVAEKRE